MDHHCVFADNCIGKRNVRYFVQFTSWACFVLGLSILVQCTLFYRQNYLETRKGVFKL